MNGERQTAVITGASSGIGREIARVLAARGYDLFILARRFDRLLELKSELEQRHGVRVMPMKADLRDPAVPAAIKAQLDHAGIEPSLLVNDAGLGTFGMFTELTWEEVEQMLLVNIGALTRLTHLFLPSMLKRRSGKILNIGSIAGSLPGPWMAVYHATKAYVASLSEALWEETRGTGVTVTLLAPGLTRTEFHEHAHQKLTSGGWMDAHTVARIGVDALLAGRPIVAAGFRNSFILWIVRFLPHRLLLWAVRKSNGR
ncbi:MAG: SDR family oxidoreductase [Candidatus Kerfeldbacteria bacterium]|nr:SDR family oxidoreductase [Candidatus Kerfeldbacteria bacterium]